MLLSFSGGQLSVFAEYKIWAKFDGESGCLTFYYSEKDALETDEYWNFDVKGTSPKWPQSEIKSVIFDESFAEARPTWCKYWFHYCSNLAKIEGIENLNTSKVESMYHMFTGCTSLTSLDLSNFNTENVTDMNSMFEECSNLTSLKLKFNTRRVKDMDNMFRDCSNLTSLDVSTFRLDSVLYMNHMFDGCSSLTALDVSKFNAKMATQMCDLFYNCTNLKSLNVSNLNSQNVTDMTGLFWNCSSLETLNLSTFNTQSAKSLNHMFSGCSNLKSLDLSNFDTKNVTDMYFMFAECSSLTSLDVSKLDTKNVEQMGNMFYGCSSLKSLDLSNFNTAKVASMDGMFVNCSSLTSLDLSNFDTASNATRFSKIFQNCSSLNSIYFSDKFKITAWVKKELKDFSGTIYCSPLQYNDLKTYTGLTSKIIILHVGINPNAEYGTLCVPIGSTLAESSYSGFDKLYTIKSANKDKGTITMEEVTTIEPGRAYVYHRNLPEDDKESIITFTADMDAATAVTAPANDGSLLKGTFERITALGGSYILQTDGMFHPVAQDNTTLSVGAYRAYLDLNSTEIGGADEGLGAAKSYKMIFEDNQATEINGISDQTCQQPNTYFDLMGRRVSTPKAGGIYVVNGKKVVYNK